jgi:hypothetical protein
MEAEKTLKNQANTEKKIKVGSITIFDLYYSHSNKTAWYWLKPDTYSTRGGEAQPKPSDSQ